MKTTTLTGYTLVELLIALTVLVTLLSLGIPNYLSFSRNNAISALAYTFQTSLQSARNAAIQKGLSVSICASNAAHTRCITTDKWENGWLIFTDENQTGQVSNQNDILRVEQAGSQQISVETTRGRVVTFEATGFPTASSQNLVFTIQPAGCSGDNARSITLQNTGLSEITALSCS